MFVSGCSSGDGKLVIATIEARSLSGNKFGIPTQQHLAIYLPPSYGQKDRRFPVLYFLPNFKTELWRYTGGVYQRFHLKEAMDRQIAKGRVQEMIVVIPNALHFLGGSFYRNTPLTGNWEDYITHDVVEYIDAHYQTIPAAPSRGLSGHGVGGTGALELALKHPELFGSVYAMSPALFDQNGLRDLDAIGDRPLAQWQARLEQWQSLKQPDRRKAFRNFMHESLNSPSRARFFQGLSVSYAAAVAAEPTLPYPHIGFPHHGQSEPEQQAMVSKLEAGFGGWSEKTRNYLAKGRPLGQITIEYTRNDEYQWIRRGAEHVSGLMHSLGVQNALAVHAGGHDSTLGWRLEEAMLPAMSSSLATR